MREVLLPIKTAELVNYLQRCSLQGGFVTMATERMKLAFYFILFYFFCAWGKVPKRIHEEKKNETLINL